MSEDLLEPKRRLFEDFTESHLRAYIKSLATAKKVHTPKIFNDPIWHSVLLHPVEIIVLDSPLLQRLRRIRQLGVAHWVYPGAQHTRFEHSIGVVHQIAQLVASINASSLSYTGISNGECIKRPLAKVLRMAALCHDVGQGVMSHVSENALENEDEIESFRLAFADKFELERPKLSEIAAYYIVDSPALRELFDVARKLSGESDFPEDAADSIRDIIIGLRFRDDIPLLHELVTGPFDADKLDYMTRDAFMAGVPVVVDIPRIVQKIRAVEIPQKELPLRVAAKVKGNLSKYTFIGIDLSGGRTLDELMLGRTLLFDKIYRHQKVRAAEAMVSSLLLYLKKLLVKNPVMIPYEFTDEELINLDKATVSYKLGRELNDEDKTNVLIACDMAARLRDRRIFARCFAFAEAMPADAYNMTNEQQLGLKRLLREIANPEKCLELRAILAEDTQTILNRLDKSDLLEQIPGQHLEPYIWISSPQPPTQGGDVTRAYLIAGERNIIPFRVEAAETRGWADAYILTRDLGYVFAPAEFSKYVFLATERYLRTEYNIHIPPTMLDYAKQESADVDNTRRALFKAGYYNASPRDIWPIPLPMLKADIDNRLDSIAASLGGYQGHISDLNSPYKGTLQPNRIKDWLRQFENDDMVEAALLIVENTRFIERSIIVHLLDIFFQQQKEFQKNFVCPLGWPKDSSAIVTYYCTDIAEKYNLMTTTLDQTVDSKKPIIFLDDFIGTGGQAVSILETWFGSTKTIDLGEERGSPLPERIQQSLRDKKLAFVFCAGWAQGVEALRNKIKELGLDALVHIGIAESELPTLSNIQGFKNSATQAAFSELCKQIGRELMIASGCDTAKADERCLGYGNKANLVVFPYNTPAQTLTCMWASGKYGGVSWVPLFPRRKKI